MPALYPTECSMRQLFSFPNPVNEVSARLVAGGVVLMSLAALVFQAEWLVVIIALGFTARVLTGPTLSVLGQLVTRVITPRLPVAAKPVPGPPKRFAQGIGVAFSVTSALLLLVFDADLAGWIVLGALAAAATLESVFAFCLGCKIFAVLMRAGIIPDTVCEACNDISARTEANLRRKAAAVLAPEGAEHLRPPRVRLERPLVHRAQREPHAPVQRGPHVGGAGRLDRRADPAQELHEPPVAGVHPAHGHVRRVELEDLPGPRVEHVQEARPRLDRAQHDEPDVEVGAVGADLDLVEHRQALGQDGGEQARDPVGDVEVVGECRRVDPLREPRLTRVLHHGVLISGCLRAA
jgi:hypothetical protein